MSAMSLATEQLVVAPAHAVTDAKRFRVLQLVLSLSPGGTERLVIEIARRLSARVDMRVCCLDGPGSWAAELVASGVPVDSLDRRPGFRPGLAWLLARYIRTHSVDVIHCHHYSPFVYGQLAALLRPGLRVVFTEHGRLDDRGPSPKRRIVNPWLGRLPFRIFSVSADLRRHMIAEGLPASRVEVVYNGIEPGMPPTAAERARARQMIGVGDDEITVGTVGRLDPVKDLPTMLTAVGTARRAGAIARLIVVGDGPERPALEACAAALGLADVVRFTGYRADVRALLPACDIYVNTSTHEGVSLTILEAMAASLPVVATDAGGNREVVADGETGVLVPPRDPAACAGALAHLAADGERRKVMGRRGRERVVRQFSIDAMLARYLEAYTSEVH
jgi:glycosyltransferase involved in cell wall biosynthesis